MSFFDDEPDEPTRVTRPARPRRSAAPAGGLHRPDPEIARRRQFVLFGGLAVVAIILIFTAKSCSNTRHKNALKDYNRNVASIVEDSDQRVSKPLFDVLGGGQQNQDVRVAVSQVRLLAEEDAKRARSLSAPDDVAAAQHDLELTMNLRAAGVTKIGDLLPRALSNQPSAAESIRRIAGQMQSFLASDVVYSQRVAPLIQQALSDNDIGGQTIATSRFLPNIGWLDPAQVGARINPDAGAGTSASSSGDVAPGTHGHGVLSVKAGGVALVPGVNRVPATAPLPLEVTYANQGQNDESNVTITAKVTGGPKTITATKRLNQTKAGTTATATLNLQSVPPKGQSTMLTVTIKPVRGEKKTDNNTQTYTVLFTP
ncbi:MAG TPA: hypothetical protein VK501_19230 [Baekduia sp.]|uniref:hypothetical protein n=1 Tax=Baekduia sp. TaxID=2600305 RepID=UPI002BC8C0B9|nr:hypothetical protein [Baekduia sp.]HMJ36046.1 hypothetical protein [Baekduia sp.]